MYVFEFEELSEGLADTYATDVLNTASQKNSSSILYYQNMAKSYWPTQKAPLGFGTWSRNNNKGQEAKNKRNGLPSYQKLKANNAQLRAQNRALRKKLEHNKYQREMAKYHAKKAKENANRRARQILYKQGKLPQWMNRQNRNLFERPIYKPEPPDALSTFGYAGRFM